MSLIAFTLLSWLPLPFLGVGNGIFREAVLKPRWGESVARPMSGITLIILIALYVLVLRRFRTVPSSDALVIGLTWVGLTIAFEFLFGYFVAKHTMAQLLANYDITTGNLWLVVVVWAGVAPYLLLRTDSNSHP
mgnify:CR=1 FL=1